MKDAKSKEEFIDQVFTSIAPRYDLLNSILSLNLHKYWREFAARKCCLAPGDSVLDVAAGTLDFAFALSKAVGPEGRVVAVDFCKPMLEIGIRKMKRRGITNIEVMEGNAERLAVPDNSFKAATIGFALRNVSDVEATLKEMVRAVEPGGRVVSLELISPENPVFRKIYTACARRIIPAVGGLISGYKEPYKYLPASVERFCSREELSAIMLKVGLKDVKVYNLTFGIAAVHVGIKE